MYLVDTNILIYYLNDDMPSKSVAKLELILIENFNISIITKMEFLGFRKYTEDSFKQAEKFLQNACLFGLDNHLVEKVIDIKRHCKIKLPDAIIAATAIMNNFTLVTRNTADFTELNVQIYNPFLDDTGIG